MNEKFYINEIVRSLKKQQTRWKFFRKEIRRDDGISIYLDDEKNHIVNPYYQPEGYWVKRKLKNASIEFQRNACDKIIENLETYPERWKIGNFLLTNKNDNMEIYFSSKSSVANEISITKPFELEPILANCKKIHTALHWYINNQDRLEKESADKREKIQKEENKKKQLSEMSKFFKKEIRREKLKKLK